LEPGTIVSSLSFVDAAMVPGSKPGTVWLLSSNHARTLTLANVTEGVGRTFDATQLAILPASVGRFSTPIVLALPPRDAEVRKSSLIVSPSGFVEALSSGFARLWTPSTGRDQTKDDRAWVEEARIIQESTVIAASVSAIEGGYLVATGDAGGSGRVWRIDKATDVEPSEDPAKVIAWACRHVTHELTVEEKFKYLPEASRSTCGSAPPVAGSQQPPATR